MRSLSPRHFEAKVAEETLKKVVPHSVATALASNVFPVPGGPNIRTPFHGLLIPCKSSKINMHDTWTQVTSIRDTQKQATSTLWLTWYKGIHQLNPVHSSVKNLKLEVSGSNTIKFPFLSQSFGSNIIVPPKAQVE